MSRADIGTIRINLLADIGGLTSGIRKATTELERWSRKTAAQLDGVGKSFTRNLTAPLAAIGAASLFAAGNFERSMNRVQALSGSTGDELERLSLFARELGATTAFSASQAADAMAALAQAGFDAEKTLAAVPHTLNLAAAAQISLAEAAKLTANVLAGSQLEVSQLEHAVDVLAKTMTSTTTDLPELGRALRNAGALGRTAGLEFEEVAAALGILASNAFQGERGGTALKTGIATLARRVAEADPLLAKLGVRVLDANGNMRGLALILKDLEESGAGFIELIQLFGTEGGPGMAALLGSGSEALEELTAKLKDSGGTAEKIAKTQLQGLYGSLTKLRSATESLLISIADSGLLDAATKIVEVTTMLVGKFDALSPRTKALAVGIGAIAITIGPALIALGLAVKSLALLVAGAGAAVTVLTGLTVAVAAVGVAVASLEIGRWLYDEFRVVQEYSADFVAVASRTWEDVKSVFTIGWPKFKIFIFEAIKGLLDEVNELLSNSVSQGVMSALPGGHILGGALQAVAPALTRPLEEAIEKANDDLINGALKMEAAMADITEVHAKALQDIDQEFGYKDRKGRSLTDFIADDILIVEEKLKGMAERLRASLETSDDATEESKKKVEELANSLEELAKQGEDTGKSIEKASDSFKNRLIDGVEGWSREVSQAFTDMVWDGERSFNQLAESFGRMLTRMLFQELAIAPIVAGIRTAVTPATANAKGNAFAGGRVVPFAKGGITTGPSTFPMRGGRTGLMGEAGPEAIMPLARTAGGGLGVRASGGVSITIIDQRSSGARPEVSESTDGSGRKRLTIMLRDEIRALMGDGSLDRTMRANYGVGRAGVAR